MAFQNNPENVILVRDNRLICFVLLSEVEVAVQGSRLCFCLGQQHRNLTSEENVVVVGLCSADYHVFKLGQLFVLDSFEHLVEVLRRKGLLHLREEFDVGEAEDQIFDLRLRPDHLFDDTDHFLRLGIARTWMSCLIWLHEFYR